MATTTNKKTTTRKSAKGLTPAQLLAGHTTKIKAYTKSAVDAADSLFIVFTKQDELLANVVKGVTLNFKQWVATLGIDLPRAYQLKGLGEARHILSKNGVTRLPIMESSVRPMLTKKDQTAKFVAVWEAALVAAGEGKQPTVKQVEEVMKSVFKAGPLTPEQEAQKIKDAQAAKDKAAAVVVDLAEKRNVRLPGMAEGTSVELSALLDLITVAAAYIPECKLARFADLVTQLHVTIETHKAKMDELDAKEAKIDAELATLKTLPSQSLLND